MSDATNTQSRTSQRIATGADLPCDCHSIALDSIQSRLYQVAADIRDRECALAEFTLIAAELTCAERAVYFHRGESDELVCGPVIDITIDSSQDSLPNQLVETGERAAAGRPTISRFDSDNTVIVAVPVAVPDRSTEALTAVLTLADSAIEPFVVSLQMIASYVTFWYAQEKRQQVDWEADVTAAIIDLMCEIERRDELKSACLVAVNKLKEILNCEAIALGLRSRGSSNRIQLRAISDLAEFDHRGETARLFEAALNDAVLSDSTIAWSATAPKNKLATLAHRKIADHLNVTNIMTSTLRSPDGDLVGAWSVIGLNASENNRSVRFIEAIGPYLGSALLTARRVQIGRLHRMVRWFTKDGSRWRWKLAVGAALLFAVIMALPLPHKISCQCRLEPLSRRYAVAPYEGVLQETFVKPGDLVFTNQTLAVMDDREMQWERSGLLADRDRAAKKRDTSLSKHEVPEAQMAQLEVDRLQLKLQLLDYRVDNLEIKSTADGIVLQGDLEGATGAPVKIGEPLFEVARLDQLRLEVGVPEEDLSHIAEGMRVVVSLDGHASQRLEGTISRIRPKAEIRDNKNVFVADVEIDNADGSLRPGMSGRAKVVSRRRMLGWILFHRAWEQIVRTAR